MGNVRFVQQKSLHSGNEFQAIYPKALKDSSWPKVMKVSYDVFSVLFFPIGLARIAQYGLNKLIGKVIVPAQYNSYYDRECLYEDGNALRNQFNGQDVSFTTPDEAARIDGMLFRKSQYAPTVVLFLGNNAKFEKSSSHMVKTYSELGFNVLTFNYRGVGFSKGSPTREGLFLDGVAAYQFVKNQFPYSRIYFHGHSLGGSIATKVAAHYPNDVRLINDRSFSSIAKVVWKVVNEIAGKVISFIALLPIKGPIYLVAFLFSKGIGGRKLLGRVMRITDKICYPLQYLIEKISIVVAIPIYFLFLLSGWNIDVKNDWKKVKMKALVVSEGDRAIPYKTSLYHAFRDENPKVLKFEHLAHCSYLTKDQIRRLISMAQ